MGGRTGDPVILSPRGMIFVAAARASWKSPSEAARRRVERNRMMMMMMMIRSCYLGVIC